MRGTLRVRTSLLVLTDIFSWINGRESGRVKIPLMDVPRGISMMLCCIDCCSLLWPACRVMLSSRPRQRLGSLRSQIFFRSLISDYGKCFAMLSSLIQSNLSMWKPLLGGHTVGWLVPDELNFTCFALKRPEARGGPEDMMSALDVYCITSLLYVFVFWLSLSPSPDSEFAPKNSLFNVLIRWLCLMQYCQVDNIFFTLLNKCYVIGRRMKYARNWFYEFTTELKRNL